MNLGDLRVQFLQDSSRGRGAVEVQVSSSLSDDEDGRERYQRVAALLGSMEGLEEAMVNEGYSGIRKLLYILRRLGLLSSLRCMWEAETLTFAFGFNALPPEIEDENRAS